MSIQLVPSVLKMLIDMQHVGFIESLCASECPFSSRDFDCPLADHLYDFRFPA